jgi:putative ABC transport system permease protein
MTGISPSQLTFALRVDAGLIVTGLVTAVAVAALGGSLAAVRAARIPVANALRMA